MTRALRSVLVGLAALTLAGYGAASLCVYNAEARSDSGAFGTFGPSGRRIASVARNRLRAAIGFVPRDGAAVRSTQDYPSELLAVRSLVRAAVRAAPADGDVVHTLAALECERQILATGTPGSTCDELLDAASSLAPTDSAVQFRIIETKFAIGRTESALRALGRLVGLNPQLAPRGVELASAFRIEPETLIASLGSSAHVLAASRASFMASGQGDAFLSLVEANASKPTEQLLESYVQAGTDLDRPERIVSTLLRMGTLRETALEATRLRLLARAYLLWDRFPEASGAARSALELAPRDFRCHEILGDSERGEGRFPEAIRSYQRALSLAATKLNLTSHRVRLYRKLADVWEHAGFEDRAVDALRLADQLAPNDPLTHEAFRRLVPDAGSRGGRRP